MSFSKMDKVEREITKIFQILPQGQNKKRLKSCTTPFFISLSIKCKNIQDTQLKNENDALRSQRSHCVNILSSLIIKLMWNASLKNLFIVNIK